MTTTQVSDDLTFNQNLNFSELTEIELDELKLKLDAACVHIDKIVLEFQHKTETLKNKNTPHTPWENPFNRPAKDSL